MREVAAPRQHRPTAEAGRGLGVKAVPDAAHVARRGEARAGRNVFDGKVGSAEHLGCEVDPDHVDVISCRHTGVFPEKPRQMPLAEVGDAPQTRQRPLGRGLCHDRILRPVDAGMDMVAPGQPGRELRIAAAAAHVDDHLPGNRQRYGGRDRLADDMQRQIDPVEMPALERRLRSSTNSRLSSGCASGAR